MENNCSDFDGCRKRKTTKIATLAGLIAASVGVTWCLFAATNTELGMDASKNVTETERSATALSQSVGEERNAFSPSGTASPTPTPTGNLVATVMFDMQCPSGFGVGVAYDGAGHLWVSCGQSNPDLLRASSVTGHVDETYNIEGGLGALAYDGT